MLANLNRVVLVGRLTRDVTLQTTKSGATLSEVGLAVNDFTKRDGRWVETPTFVDITLWHRTAEVAARYLTKGSEILVEGKLRQVAWKDQETGLTKTKLKVVCERLRLLSVRESCGRKPDPIERPTPNS